MNTEYILIGKFMGIEPCLCGCQRWVRIGTDEMVIEDPDYANSWDWLMSVVIQINIIEDFRFSVQIDTMDTTIHDLKKGGFIFKSECKWQTDELIKSVYEAVLFFINWYNQQKQNENGK